MSRELFNIFETPWLIIIIAAVAWIVISLISIFKGLEQRRWRLFIPLLLGLIAFPVDYFVMTDYETIDLAMNTITTSAVELTPQKIEPLISEDYSDAANKSKAQLMRFFNRNFSEPNIQKINRRFFTITVDRPTAMCEMDLVIILNPESRFAEYANILSVETKAYFQRNPDGKWLMTSSEIIKVNNHPTSWKNVP